MVPAPASGYPLGVCAFVCSLIVLEGGEPGAQEGEDGVESRGGLLRCPSFRLCRALGGEQVEGGDERGRDQLGSWVVGGGVEVVRDRGGEHVFELGDARAKSAAECRIAADAGLKLHLQVARLRRGSGYEAADCLEYVLALGTCGDRLGERGGQCVDVAEEDVFLGREVGSPFVSRRGGECGSRLAGGGSGMWLVRRVDAGV